jgi:hypothetical protein
MKPQLLAQVEELSDWIGEPIESDADRKRAELCLRIASALVRTETGKKWDDANATIPDAAVMVTLYCASRVYENREAETQSGVDDWQTSQRVLEAGAYLTASERRMLSALNRPQFRGLGTVSTTRDEIPEVNGWVPTDTPDVKFPWY